MKKVSPLRVLLITLLLLNNDVSSAFQNPDDEAKIRKTLMDYIEGTANGEPERLRRAFHPDFNLYSTTEEGELSIWKGQDYIGRIKEGEKANRIGRIVSIDLEGLTATAKVEIAVPEHVVFTDYFLLSKYQDQWKIVHKSFSRRPFSEADKITLRNAHLDTIFSEFDRPNHPALTVLAIHEGEIVYQRAFGSTSIDSELPATVQTKFQLAGMSKHFTAFATLLLEEQGKISLSDDIRTYLSWLPIYEQPITINHLLSASSGLSDFWELKELSGWHNSDVFTRQHAIELIKRLKPAFAPGTNHLHSNTDQLLLSEIIAQASGKSYAAYLQDELFFPLGMKNTLVAEGFNQYIPDLAVSYAARDDGSFLTNPTNYGIYGPTNIYSSIADLARWELHLLDPKVGSKALVDKLYATCKLNDGSTLDSWYGRNSYAQQYYHWGHGIKEVYQIASLGGYSSNIFKFPDQGFTVIVMSSGLGYSGYLGMQLAYHFIGDEFQDPEAIDFQKLKTVKIKQKELERFEGFYWSDQSCFSRTIKLSNDTLRYVRADGRSSALLPVSKNTFQMKIPGSEVVILSFDDTEQMTFTSGDVVIRFRKTDRVSDEARLDAYAGTYYCPSLRTSYTLGLRGNQLIASHHRAGEITLQPVMKHSFEGDREFFSSIHFTDDLSKFRLDTESVKGVWFKKISLEMDGINQP